MSLWPKGPTCESPGRSPGNKEAFEIQPQRGALLEPPLRLEIRSTQIARPVGACRNSSKSRRVVSHESGAAPRAFAGCPFGARGSEPTTGSSLEIIVAMLEPEHCQVLRFGSSHGCAARVLRVPGQALLQTANIDDVMPRAIPATRANCALTFSRAATALAISASARAATAVVFMTDARALSRLARAWFTRS